MTSFTPEEIAALARPHVARAWFLEADLPSGMAYFHNGTGRKVIEGKTWRGVTDPIGGQLVSLSGVEEPRFGQAVAVEITLSGANREFFKSVHDTARELEGRAASIYWATFDQETEKIIGTMKRLFPGKLTAPGLRWQGVGVRRVKLTVISIWEGQNYPFGGVWSGAGQRRRYPDDKGLDFAGVKVDENWD